MTPLVQASFTGGDDRRLPSLKPDPTCRRQAVNQYGTITATLSGSRGIPWAAAVHAGTFMRPCRCLATCQYGLSDHHERIPGTSDGYVMGHVTSKPRAMELGSWDEVSR
ncbi:hypothetical protein Bbelb_266920 [Branchiostoma belcheri]|nr:hypothetical protein Bbelb_266920 [Branchiostoma belcheri]